MTIASLTLLPARSKRFVASSRETPQTSITMRWLRSISLLFVARRSTMRLPYVLPSQIIAPVVMVFSTSLVAVPAFIRVEPVTTSGPTIGSVVTSTLANRSAGGGELATASGTLRSSAFIMSTISSGDARSIDAVRGLRRSVSRGSNINALLSGEPRPKLPDASRQSQDKLEQDDETFFSGVIDGDVMCRITQRAATAAGVFQRSQRVGERFDCRVHCQRRKRWPN